MTDHADSSWVNCEGGVCCTEATAIMDALVARAEAAEAQRDRANVEWHRIRDLHGATIQDLRVVEADRDEAIACLQRVVEADRDDSRMGHPNAGDSCIGACIGLDVMPWLDQRGKLLPFIARAALAEDTP